MDERRGQPKDERPEATAELGEAELEQVAGGLPQSGWPDGTPNSTNILY